MRHMIWGMLFLIIIADDFNQVIGYAYIHQRINYYCFFKDSCIIKASIIGKIG